MVKRIYCLYVLLFAVVFFQVITSDSLTIAADRKTGKVIVITKDVIGNKLANVQFTLDDDPFNTGENGEMILTVSANEEHTVIFGDVEGHAISEPENSEITFVVKPRRKKTITGTYKIDTTDVVQFEPTECKHELAEGSITSCGFLIVPENRNDLDSKTIKVYLTIFKNPDPDSKKAPLIWLTGGPGASTADAVSLFENTPTLPEPIGDMPSLFRDNRELIVVDQRGTNFSEPALYCSEETGPLREEVYALPFREQSEARVEAIEACFERLSSEGNDLSGYTTFENAADIKDLRDALGYDKIDLYGVSYGTRLCMTIMKESPEIIRSVTLDSVLPPEINPFEDQPNGIMYALHSFFDASRDDFPDTEELFFEITTRLEETPVDTSVPDPDDPSQNIVIPINGVKFVSYVFGKLRSTPYDSSLPLTISQIHDNEDYTDVANAWIGNVNFFFPAGEAGSNDPSLGMFESMTASSDGFYTTMEKVFSMIDFHNTDPAINAWSKNSFYFSEPAVQGLWDVEPVGPSIQYPVISDIPTLLFAGAIDSGTPPIWAESSARYLSNSFPFRILAGHATTFLECSVEMMNEFISDPSSKPEFQCDTEFVWDTSDSTPVARILEKYRFIRLND